MDSTERPIDRHQAGFCHLFFFLFNLSSSCLDRIVVILKKKKKKKKKEKKRKRKRKRKKEKKKKEKKKERNVKETELSSHNILIFICPPSCQTQHFVKIKEEILENGNVSSNLSFKLKHQYVVQMLLY